MVWSYSFALGCVKVNPRDEDGQTPLHLACFWGHLHTVGLLLGHNGIDANVVDNDGDTPLHVAVRRCTYCQVMYASSDFKPCEHIALCRDCYIRIKGESCPTCHQPISGVREFEAPKFEDRCVQTEAICQELGAASQAIESPKSEDKCVQTEVASEEIGFQKLDERYLLKLACQLGGNWWKVGIFLGIKSIQLGIIRHDFLVMFKSRASRCCSTGQHIVIRGSYGGYIEGSSCGS
ncbi:E3 ubiquitin-protein ligase MIB2-like isoform X1 [Octopus vulgaris]|uniref:E3 ubiquitin-protein ligase MIB2-like isoform X1 n=1 Tax=Octopus vulgaris TaxID=6645 RepID=A0AA36HIQ7_OCTVU|nr:E3 ubiquitin-protein ligase MIB2-like isoform X1 [Octopus vulgaris]